MYKFRENELIKELDMYVYDTYGQHYATDKYQLLNEAYERSFNFASASDNDGVNLRVQPTVLNLG